MKKTIIMLVAIILLAAKAMAGEGEIKYQVRDAFNNKFVGAKEITWTINQSFYEVGFNYKGVWLTAYYNADAELVGTVHNIAVIQLPASLQKTIKRKYTGADYWIVGLFEMPGNEVSSYYISLKNADNEIVLESKNGKSWHEYKFENNVVNVQTGCAGINQLHQ